MTSTPAPIRWQNVSFHAIGAEHGDFRLVVGPGRDGRLVYALTSKSRPHDGPLLRRECASIAEGKAIAEAVAREFTA